MLRFVPFVRPQKVGSFTKGGEQRTPRVRACLEIEEVIDVIYAVTYVKLFKWEAWKKVKYYNYIESLDTFPVSALLRVHKPSGWRMCGARHGTQ